MNSSIIRVLVVCALFLSACDSRRIADENKDISGEQWDYRKPLTFDIDIRDTAKKYNVYLNTRISSDYRYANMFVWLHTLYPDKTTSKTRFDFTLADETGKWLGKGLGDIYDYRLPFYMHHRFHQAGIYRFTIEQNMRDDTLMHVKSAGIRIELDESTN